MPISVFEKVKNTLFSGNRFYGKLLCSAFVGILSIVLLAGILLNVAFKDHQYENSRKQALEAIRLSNKAETCLNNIGTLLRYEPREEVYQQLDQERETMNQCLRGLIGLFDGSEKESIEKTYKQFNLLIGDAKTQKGSFNAERLVPLKKNLQEFQKNFQLSLSSLTRDQHLSGLSQSLIFISKLETTISVMQKAHKDYLSEKNNESLNSYKKASGEFYTFHGHLTILLADSPAQLKKLQVTLSLVDRWQQKVAQPQLGITPSDKGKPLVSATPQNIMLISEAQKQITQLEADEYSNYMKASEQAELQRILRTGGFSFLCLLAISFLVASCWYSYSAFRRYIRKIEAAESQTRSIIENSLDGIIIMDERGVIQSMNPAAEKMFDVTSLQTVDQNISRFIPRHFLFDKKNKWRNGTVMAMGNRKNHPSFPIEISLSEVQITRNRRHFAALIRDVTERKRSEEILRHISLGISSSTGEEFVRSLVKQLSKALETDFAFIVETQQKAGRDMNTLVFAEDEHIQSRPDYRLSKTVCEQVLRRGFQVIPARVQELFPEDAILREFQIESFVGLPLMDHRGRVLGVMGVWSRRPLEDSKTKESILQIFAERAAAEIERKRFEEDLAAEKERLAVTLRSIADGFIATDVDGKVIMMNNVAEHLTGWSYGEAIEKPLTEVFNLLEVGSRRSCMDALKRVIQTGAMLGLSNNNLMIARDGTELLIETSAAPIRDTTNRKIGIVLVFRDITAKSRAEEELRKNEKLESLGVAAGGIAHDFNNLLTAILGNLSLALVTIKPEEDLADLLTAAKKASMRAQELAQQLLTFAKGGSPIKKTATVGQLIYDTVTFSLRGSNTRSEFSLPKELWAVDIDAGQISQVIGNLAINAKQAMPAGGIVKISCENYNHSQESSLLPSLKVGKYVKISVRDEGIGIPEKFLEKIFDPYFTTKPKGSGLGLATSYSIIKNHDGLITVESTPGTGSVFHIYLPASEKEAPPEIVTKPDLIEGKGRILVLDDEEAICSIVTHALTPLGYTVVESNDAVGAIRRYDEALKSGQRFDAVIMDLTIPGGMGGREAIKILQQLDPKVRAIVCSGYAMDPIMANHKDYGFCACLTKPYEINDLNHIVHDVVTSAEAEKLVYHEFNSKLA